VTIQPDAITDASEAAAWYEEQKPGLGIEFLLELDMAIERAAENPQTNTVQYRNVRRALVRRFPYSVYYHFEGDKLDIFEILHHPLRAPSSCSRTRASSERSRDDRQHVSQLAQIVIDPTADQCWWN